MNILSITHCSALKEYPPKIQLGDFSGPQKQVETEWVNAVNKSIPDGAAQNIYKSRWIKLLFSKASRDNLFFIVSAGFGLICMDTDIPSYDCTIAKGQNNSLDKSCASKPDLTSWWNSLLKTKYSCGSISEIANKFDLVLMSLTSPYLKLVINDIEMVQTKVVVFTGAGANMKFANTNILLSPYTNAFDGPASPTKGLKSDFAQRCHFDFIDRLKMYRNLEKAIFSVKKDMSNWPNPPKIINQKMDDAELISLIDRYKNNFSSIGSMHKFFRHELNIACEQKRFSNLYRKVMS